MISIGSFLASFVEQNKNKGDILQVFKEKYPTVNDIFKALELENLDIIVQYDFVNNEEIPRVLAIQKPAVLAINAYPQSVCLWVEDDIEFPDLQSKKQFVNGFLRAGYLVTEILKSLHYMQGGKL